MLTCDLDRQQQLPQNLLSVVLHCALKETKYCSPGFSVEKVTCEPVSTSKNCTRLSIIILTLALRLLD